MTLFSVPSSSSLNSSSTNAILQETKALQLTQPQQVAPQEQQAETLIRSGLRPVAYVATQFNNPVSFLPPLPATPNYKFANFTSGQQSMSNQSGSQGGNQRNPR